MSHYLQYSGECGECGKDVSRVFKTAVMAEKEGIHLKCRDCGHRNWITESEPL